MWALKGNSVPGIMEQSSEEDLEETAKQVARRTFAVLRPLCTKLLETVTTRPDECAQLLISLQALVRKEPVVGLQACLDYLLFPVVLLLDAAVACRTNKGAQEGHKRLNVGDKVAESAVTCLMAVLEKCPCQSVSQMTTLVRKLTGAAMLSPAEASEEFRHGIVKCLRSVFEALQACKSLSCSCKYILPSPFSILKQDPGDLYEGYGYIGEEEDVAGEEYTVDYAAPEVCPLGYLQSVDMAPAIGHLLSLFLQIADREAALGGVGSGKLREDAISALRVVLLRVANADALAFFLPGVVSGLAKAIRSSMVASKRSMTTATYKSVGAAGSTGALEESLRGLAELLVLVLADSRNLSCLSELDPEPSETGHGTDQVEAALENLQVVLLKEDRRKAGESLKAEVHGDSNMSGLSIANAAPHHKELFKAEAPTLGAPLRLKRDRKWLESIVARLESILSESLPLLCAHPSATVRLAVVESAAVLLFSCGGTLEKCTSLFLECLLALACDEWQYVASAASSSLVVLLSIDEFLKESNGGNEGEKLHRSRCIHRSKLQKQAILNLLQRLLERLPQAVFTGNETLAVLHARRLAAALYFVGPEAVCSTFLVSLEACQRFVNIMLQCLSFSSTFAGPIDLSVLSTASKSQALLVISDSKTVTEDDQPETSKKQKQQKLEEVVAAEQLPRMPPWLSQVAQRVYKAIASIIRLVGRAAGSGRPGDPALMRVVETLLDTLQQAADELCQQQEQRTNSLDLGSGQQQRATAASACVLSELVYGASGVWTHELASLFGLRSSKESCGFDKWQYKNDTEVEARICESMGSILHDYLMPELWDLPVDAGTFSDRGYSMVDMPPLHVLQDNAMLQQVLVEGIGVFGLALGKAFEDKGFLALVLYPLLEKLASTNSNVSFAADLALRAICYHSGYQSVKELVVQNADYVVDSLCRQLRHLELHPLAPSLLTAILRHTGAAPHLLPLLEEPMQCIILELEVPARSRHPEFTVPLLRALREIAKAARVEGGIMVTDAARTSAEIRATLTENLDVHSEAGQMIIEQVITEIQERERRRKSVASVGTSCLYACAPLLASQDTQTCLLVLDAIEDGIAGLADMDATFPHLQAQRIAVEEFLKTSANGDPDAADPFGTHHDESNRSNILLPSMNQVWPQLVPCLRHTQPAVLVRVLAVIANLIAICGGQFFTRRIAKDALPLLLKLLRDGPSLIMSRPSDALRPKSSKELLLLRNQGNGTPPAAKLKVQQAVLKCIEIIAGHQRSSPALETTYKPIVSWVVALACKVQALQAAAAETLVALSNLDSDLVWLVVADLVYDGHSQGLPSPGDAFPTFLQIFPPLATPNDALWVQYSNHNGDSVVDRRAAEKLLVKLVSSYENIH